MKKIKLSPKKNLILGGILSVLLSSNSLASPISIRGTGYGSSGNISSSRNGVTIDFDTNNLATTGSYSGTTTTSGDGFLTLQANNINPQSDIRPFGVATALGLPNAVPLDPDRVAYTSFNPAVNGGRGLITLSAAAGFGFANNPANDFFYFDWGNNEGVLARLRDQNGQYTEWRYVAASVASQDANPNNPDFLTWGTVMDFDNFGLAANLAVSEIQFQGILEGDAGNFVANGYWTFDPNNPNVGQTTFSNPQTGFDFRSSGLPGYSNGTDLTADIWLAGGFHDLVSINPVPEPMSLLLLSSGLLIARRFKAKS